MSAEGPEGFDAVIHSPNRLRICALLSAVDDAEFALVQERLGVSASVLSKHVGVLSDAGYVAQERALRDARQRVRLRLTRAGRAAFRAHTRALRSILESPDGAGSG